MKQKFDIATIRSIHHGTSGLTTAGDRFHTHRCNLHALLVSSLPQKAIKTCIYHRLKRLHNVALCFSIRKAVFYFKTIYLTTTTFKIDELYSYL